MADELPVVRKESGMLERWAPRYLTSLAKYGDKMLRTRSTKIAAAIVTVVGFPFLVQALTNITAGKDWAVAMLEVIGGWFQLGVTFITTPIGAFILLALCVFLFFKGGHDAVLEEEKQAKLTRENQDQNAQITVENQNVHAKLLEEQIEAHAKIFTEKTNLILDKIQTHSSFLQLYDFYKAAIELRARWNSTMREIADARTTPHNQERGPALWMGMNLSFQAELRDQAQVIGIRNMPDLRIDASIIPDFPFTSERILPRNEFANHDEYSKYVEIYNDYSASCKLLDNYIHQLKVKLDNCRRSIKQ